MQNTSYSQAPWVWTADDEAHEETLAERCARAEKIAAAAKALEYLLNDAIKSGDRWFDDAMDEAASTAAWVLKNEGDVE